MSLRKYPGWTTISKPKWLIDREKAAVVKAQREQDGSNLIEVDYASLEAQAMSYYTNQWETDTNRSWIVALSYDNNADLIMHKVYSPDREDAIKRARTVTETAPGFSATFIGAGVYMLKEVTHGMSDAALLQAKKQWEKQRKYLEAYGQSVSLPQYIMDPGSY